MLSLFKEQLAIHKLCTGEDPVLLAVSGGLDSMTLLNLFHLSGYTLGVAHCNFQLRGKASNEDELFVRTVCAKLGVPFHSAQLDTDSYAKGKKRSIQVAARELRYNWLFHVMKEKNYRYIATAHHLNDDLETVLINLVRGSGFAGLQGIPIKVGSIIRPLLNFSRENIEQYARKNNIIWREDATNSTEKYMRNKIRLHVLPMLKQLNPSLESTFLKHKQRLAGAAELFNLGKNRLKKTFITSANNDIKIDKSILNEVNNPVAILWEVIKEYGFNYDQCHTIVECCTRGDSVGKTFLSPTYRLVIDRSFIWMNNARYIWKTITLDERSTEAFLGPWHLRIKHDSVADVVTDTHRAVFDAACICWPLRWRKWKAGDRFYPLGMNHRKKISDFFIDEKLSFFDKDRATVVESGGDIIWVSGHRIDDRFKVTDKTNRVLILFLESCF